MSSVHAARPAALLGALVAVLLSVMPHAVAEEPGIGLGTAESFAVLAATGITNTGATTVTGDIGSHPNGAFTNTGTFTLNGTNHANDPVTEGAKVDLVTAYEDAEASLPETEIAAELGSLTLQAGVYTSETDAFLLTGTLTLDAAGVRDAQFVFKTGSTITTAVNSTVRLINSADPCHVVWQIGSSATFNGGTTFVGDVLALTSITANTGATFEGRLLASNGAVTLQNNTITAGACRAGETDGAATPTPSPTAAPSATASAAPTSGPGGSTAPTTPVVTAGPGAPTATSEESLVPAGTPGLPDLTAGAPGRPDVAGPEVTGGPDLPSTGWLTLAYALTGLAMIVMGVFVVRTGNGCRPGRHAAHHAR